MSHSPKRSIKSIALLITVCFIAFQATCFLPRDVIAASKDDLKKIEYKYYFRGNYEKAIVELRAFLERKDLSEAETIEAREYLAASYIMTDAADAGKAEYITLLKMKSDYRGPDPAVFKPIVVATFDQARAEYASTVIRNVPDSVAGAADAASPGEEAVQTGKPLYKKWWFYATMGAALLVIAGAASSGKEDAAPTETGTVTVGVSIP